jgi:ferredoxin-NADP reductase
VSTATPPASGALSAALVSRAIIGPGIVDLCFAMRDPSRLRFRAGQFVSVALRGNEAASGGSAPAPLQTARRSYSIASRSDAGERLRFIIKVIPNGVASDFLMSLSPGEEVRMTGPHGFFVLDAEHAGDVVFGATGTGVSAVMPMLHELAAQPEPGRRVLYWGVRHEDDFFARAEIEDLCRRARCELRLFVTRPGSGWSGGQGRITAAVLDDYKKLPDPTSPTFYLVGNGTMIAELKRELIALGVNRKKQIRTEAFFD